jgi:hypothetical protein
MIFSKKLLCKVPIFFIHHLGSRKVESEEKSGSCHLKKLVMTSLQTLHNAIMNFVPNFMFTL